MSTKATPKGDRPFLSVTPLEAVVLVGVILFFVCIAFGGSSRPLSAGNRVRATSDALQIKTAILAYNTEIGDFPIPPGSPKLANGNYDDLLFGPAMRSDPSRVPSAATIALYQALAGNINAYNATTVVTGINPKNIVYLSVQKNNCDGNGVMISPWKTYFSIKIDSNYDNILNGLPNRYTGKFDGSTTDICAVWCNNDQTFLTPNLRWTCTY